MKYRSSDIFGSTEMETDDAQWITTQSPDAAEAERAAVVAYIRRLMNDGRNAAARGSLEEALNGIENGKHVEIK